MDLDRGPTDRADDFVNVAIRIRPSIAGDGGECAKGLTVISNDPPIIYVDEKQQTFSFDTIFNETSDQQKVYEDTVRPLVDNVLEGYNGTVFAYGHTGTGKTFTIGTNPEQYANENTGLISRCLEDIFSQNDENKEITTYISFFEIYNEKVFDLLSNEKGSLTVKGFTINGLEKREVDSEAAAKKLLLEGGKNRHTGETKRNSKSSRSHAIFTIHCHVKGANSTTEAKLNLVDLAGSESPKKTGNEGNQLHEGININMGLLSIGQVINALSANRSYVPYRQSMITTILRDSLNRKNYITFIVCVAPDAEHVHETVQSLKFAQNAKRLKSRPELNSLVMEYTKSKTVLQSVDRKRPLLRTAYPHVTKRRNPFQTPSRSISASVIGQQIERPFSTPFTLEQDFESSVRSDMSLASMSSIALHDVPVNLSPIIKKCIDAVESSILKKLEAVVRQSMATPAAEPTTPSFSWNNLQTEVTKMVHSEYELLESRRRTRSFRDSSRRGRVEDENIRTDSENDEIGNASPKNDLDLGGTSPIYAASNTRILTPIFKIPKPMPRRVHKLKTSSPLAEQRPTRNSLRLSQQNFNSPVKTRRSVRISLRQSMVPPTPLPRKKTTPIKSGRVSRKSIVKKKDTLDHTQNMHVLNLLNVGSEGQLVTLNTIGSKAAAMIVHYRRIHGNFSKLSDLKNLPWRGNGLSRFIDGNFLSL